MASRSASHETTQLRITPYVFTFYELRSTPPNGSLNPPNRQVDAIHNEPFSCRESFPPLQLSHPSLLKISNRRWVNAAGSVPSSVKIIWLCGHFPRGVREWKGAYHTTNPLSKQDTDQNSQTAPSTASRLSCLLASKKGDWLWPVTLF